MVVRRAMTKVHDTTSFLSYKTKINRRSDRSRMKKLYIVVGTCEPYIVVQR